MAHRPALIGCAVLSIAAHREVRESTLQQLNLVGLLLQLRIDSYLLSLGFCFCFSSLIPLFPPLLPARCT